MKRNEILNVIRELAYSQGFYGSLYRYLTSGTDGAEWTIRDLEAQGFRDVVDLVMYVEY